MKARVKATGALLIVRPYCGSDFDWICDMDGETGTLWKTEELDFTDDYEPDYWEKLKHQYAGMAMRCLIIKDCSIKEIVETSSEIAIALVNKLKEESQCKE